VPKKERKNRKEKTAIKVWGRADVRVGAGRGTTSRYVGGGEPSVPIKVHAFSTGVLGTLIAAGGSFFDGFCEFRDFSSQ